ncbi:branched-chain amino acid aminotransferase [Synechococcus sp. RS9916]|nr:branched-chain amino acid aminotransferase [Synechococcus sp. RS9916]
MASSTQEPNNDQPARMPRRAQVVVDLGGMAERGKR